MRQACEMWAYSVTPLPPDPDDARTLLLVVGLTILFALACIGLTERL